jgi:hypothetical protein
MAGAGRPTLRVDPQKDRPSAPNRLLMPSSAHCTATPVAAWRRVIASPSVALASKSAACRVCGRRWAWRLLAQQLGSDSNRRPSDYESKSLRPAGAAQTRPGCSRQRGRLLNTFLSCRVWQGNDQENDPKLTYEGQGSWRPSDRDRLDEQRMISRRETRGAQQLDAEGGDPRWAVRRVLLCRDGRSLASG